MLFKPLTPVLRPNILIPKNALTCGMCPNIWSSSSSEVGDSAGVLLSMLIPPVRLWLPWLEFCPCASPWVGSESPPDRLREVSLDTRTLRLRLKRWRLCEAALLGWDGWRNKGLMKQGLMTLHVWRGVEGGGGPLGRLGDVWELQNSENIKEDCERQNTDKKINMTIFHYVFYIQSLTVNKHIIALCEKQDFKSFK